MSMRRPKTTGARTPRREAAKVPSNLSKSTRVAEVPDDYETEMEKLRNQLTIEMRRNTMLDSELRLALSAAHKAEEAHQAELKTSESDVKRLISERRALQAKFADIEVVEGSLRELYVQMKDRLTEDAPHPQPDQLRSEKASLEKEPILAVIGALRARLEGLWAFKVQAEDDLRASRHAQQQRADAEASMLKADMRALEAELRQSQKELLAAKAETAAAKEALAALADEAHAVTADMAAQHAELLAALRASVKEAGVAQRQAAAAYAEGKARDALVLANRQLESARHFDRVTQDKELRRLQHDHEREVGEMVHELSGYNLQMMTNSQLRQQLAQAKGQIAQLQREALQPSERSALQHRIRLLEQDLDAAQRALGATLRRSAAELQRPGSSGGGQSPPRLTVPLEGVLSASPPGTPGSPNLPLAQTRQMQGRANASMKRNAHAIMSGARAAAERARKQAAAQIEDPLYHFIANVGVMHQAAKGAVRGVRNEIASLGYSSEPAAELASQPQVTNSLETVLQPKKNMLGAAGTNDQKPIKHKPVCVT